MQHVESLATGHAAELPLEQPERKRKPRPPLASLRWLGLAVLVFGLTVGAECLFGQSRAATRVIGLPGFGLSTVLALAGGIRSLVDIYRGHTVVSGALGALLNLVLGAVGLFMAAVGALTTLFATVGFTRGRQLRRFGRVLLPPVHAGGNWVDASLKLDATGAPRGLGPQWRENGRTEHASVASFARLTLDLMALGAPPVLITAANQDALDEIRHTEVCFALAHALDGQLESPGPFPEAQRARTLPRIRVLALAELAVLSLVDGALHEGVSARVIAKLARRAQEPTIANALRQIAADEGRHAAHGWDVVEWCLAEGGAAVAQAIEGALPVLPLRMHSSLPEPAVSGAWEPWGIHGAALEQAEYAAARADLIARVQRLTQRAKAA